jgi:glycosyltransferase involved in cell wall biosynthesis
MEVGEKLNILYLPRWYPNRYDPMPGLFIERHARSVAGLANVAVLYVHHDDQLNTKFETEIFRDDELIQYKIYFRPFKGTVKPWVAFINFLRLIRFHRKGLKLLRKEWGNPDLVHVNVLTRLGLIALIYKLVSGTPYVITEHWTRYLPHMDNFTGFFRKLASRIVVKHASAVLPVTDNLRKAMESHGLKNKNYRIIPNVVDMEMFQIRDDNAYKKIKNFIHVSCFEDKQKNISGILRVLKKISAERNDWICHMVGEGIHLDRLKEYAKELDLDEKLVVFHGLKENEELAGMMADAEFQVLFSRFENLPVVILESYACGVPVLSTDVGGINEHMNKHLGLLIESEDESMLYEKVNYLLDQSGNYRKETIRNYALEHFSREVIGEQLYAAYINVTGTS